MIKKIHSDVFIIGGGINGVGIARDLAGRGVHAVLCEKNDLASATSSGSSKLIHGGLRYLEQYDFKLVHESLKERKILMHTIPHLATKLGFVLPHIASMRPKWLVRLGLYLYDILSGWGNLPKSKKIHLQNDQSPWKNILKSTYITGFRYFDGWTNDARLVIENAIDATRRGAQIFTYHECINIRFDKKTNLYIATLKNTLENAHGKSDIIEIHAKSVINAAGPWVKKILDDNSDFSVPGTIKPVRGSHILVPKLHDEKDALILQAADNRIIFVIPYLFNTSLIGTTDVIHDTCLDSIETSEEEKKYLIDIVNHYFKKQLSIKDIISSYAAVRPLYDDGSDNPSQLTRDYTIKVHLANTESKKPAPMITIFGGKLTTYRHLSEIVIKKLQPYISFQSSKRWTDRTPLVPLPEKLALPHNTVQYPKTLNELLALCQQSDVDLTAWPLDLMKELYERHGPALLYVLDFIGSPDTLGKPIIGQLYEGEVLYFIDHEYAKTVEDILWRRTKYGYIATDETYKIIEKILTK